MANSTGQLIINIIPDDGDDLADDWQHDCEVLMGRLNQELGQYDAHLDASEMQLPDEYGISHRDGGMESFSKLLLSLKETGVVGAVFDSMLVVLGPWLERRKGTKVSIELDGKKFEVEGFTDTEFRNIVESIKLLQE